jgi:hypothetical protein
MRIRAAVLEVLHAELSYFNQLPAQAGPGTCAVLQPTLKFLKAAIIWSRRTNEILLYPI